MNAARTKFLLAAVAIALLAVWLWHEYELVASFAAAHPLR